MQITPVDHYCDLFQITDVFPQHIVDYVLDTDWLNLPWQRQEGQEFWARRRIEQSALPWMPAWNQHLENCWSDLAAGLGRKLHAYQGTAWWLDEPGFTCAMHTDGEMPGAMQLMWVGANANLGTAFYHYRQPEALRYQFSMTANSGYVMINTADATGARHLQWHAMLTPVPANTFRLCSYIWISEQT